MGTRQYLLPDMNLERGLQKPEGKKHCICRFTIAELLDCRLVLPPVMR